MKSPKPVNETSTPEPNKKDDSNSPLNRKESRLNPLDNPVGRLKSARDFYIGRSNLQHYDRKFKLKYLTTKDPTRYATMLLALEHIRERNITGDLAELGVYKGDISSFIHSAMPERRIYLFDTFEGFSNKDLEEENIENRHAFSDCDVESVMSRMINKDNVSIRKGYFPDTAAGLEGARFALVSIDVDIYPATIDGLNFFYPRLSKNGYIFVHDYNAEGWKRGVKRAVDEFCGKNQIDFVEIPDMFGSVIIRG